MDRAVKYKIWKFIGNVTTNFTAFTNIYSIYLESSRCTLDDDIPLHRYRYKCIF